MGIKYIDDKHFLFGGKGDVWNNTAHIAGITSSMTLCGKPMLSSNWVAIEDVSKPGCKTCIEIYEKSKIRSIRLIAIDIKNDWKKVSPHAMPYLTAMMCIDKPTDKFGFDDADDIVRRFLCNAQTWRGENAKKIKAELKQIFKIK